MNTMLKRIISLLLCFVLVVGYVPANAFAAENDETIVTETTEPSTEATEPSAEATDPSTEATEPSSEATEPSAEATEPSTEATEPSTEATEPSVEITDHVIAEIGVGLGETALEEEEIATVTYDLDEVEDAAIFFSDLHAGKPNGGSYTSKESILKGVLTAARDTGLSFSSVTSVGDLFAVNSGSSDNTSLTAAQADKDLYTGYIQDVLGSGVTANYTWSDHDRTSDIEDYTGLIYGDNGTESIADDKNYYIYAISMSDTATNDRYNTGVFGLEQETLDAFTATMERLDPSKPVFIASHQPLIATNRKDNGNGYKWFEVINEAAEDRDIVFFWGHNHKYDAAEYYCYEVGDDMPVQNGSSSVIAMDINFSHICTGYLDPTTQNGDGQTRTGTILVVGILEDEIAVTTYNSQGVYTKSNALDLTIERQHEDDELPGGTDTPEGYVLARVEVINQGTTKYFLNETLDTDSLVVEAVYTKENAANVRKTLTLQTAENKDGYTVSGFDMSKPGKQYVTVTYGERTGSFAIEVFETHFENETGSVAVDFTNYGITSVAIAQQSKQVEGYSAYVTYDITPAGYTQGDEATVTIALDTALFDLNRPVKVLDQGAVIATPEIVDGKITFTTNHFSEYDVTQVDADALNWVQIPGGDKDIFRLTDILTSGKYVIVSTNAAGAATATNLNGDSINTTSVTVIADAEGNYIEAPATSAQWTYTSNRFQNVGTTNRYLRGNNNTLATTTNTNDSYTRWSLNNGALRVRQYSNSGSYRYMTSVTNTATSSNGGVYLYVEDSIKTETTYAALGGQQSQSYATADNVSLETVLNKLVVYTSADGAAVGDTVGVTSSMVTWDKAFDGSAAGTYTGTVKYNNVTLGNVTVTVSDRVAVDVKLDKYEGTVERDSSLTAETGAYLSVLWVEGGTPERIPVTLAMLSGTFNANRNGTYSGLSVSYGGETFENFTLKVVNKTGVNDFPQYPNPGSIDLKKSATGVDFQNTGVARVELSASGLPAEKGVDVVIVIDTSSSMRYNASGSQVGYDNTNSRYQIMKRSLGQMLTTFQTANTTTGVIPDIDVAIIDFNGYGSSNYIDNASLDDQYRTDADNSKVYTVNGNAQTITGLTLGAQHFMKNTDINVDTMLAKFTTGYSGTNYDVAFQNAYDLLVAKKAANTEEREQFVIFMSDGASFRYNGFMTGNSGNRTRYDQWLDGIWADAAALKTYISQNNYHAASANFAYLYNGNGNTHPHRMAEAIKGDPSKNYEVVLNTSATDTDGDHLYSRKGLGAKIYSVGFCMQDDTSNGTTVREETLREIIRTLSSGEGYYVENATDEAQLSAAFKDIASQIAMAASNARYVDQMGDSFNLQMNPTIETNATGSGTTTTNTDITITTRPVYTKEDADAGKCAVADIGKPYGNGTTVETVKFTAGANGSITATTTAGGYKLPNGTTVTANSTNILVDGVIYGKNFFYNNNNTAVTVTLANGSTYSLPGETFYWNIGTINETLYTISYTVYLEGSMDGEGPGPGTYDTNNFAVLYYTNHVGNEVNKSVGSPSLAWKGANVSYAFYLVNDAGQPVHADGTLAQNFLQAHKLTQPVVYSSQELNSVTGAYLSAAALAVLPEGYALFDQTATYQVWVGSGSGEGSNVSRWLISGENTTNTTCVVGFGDANDYSYVRDVQNTNEAYKGYDYTHTTVYFAVKWIVGAVQDTVVIDYGLPVDISVMGNDMFGADGTLYAVGKRLEDGTVPAYGSVLASGFSTSSINGTYGTATLNNGKVRYKLDSMKMPHSEKLAYAVDYQGEANKGYYYGAITVIPATTVYFEDEYVDLTTYKDKTYVEHTYTENSNKTITYYELKDGKYKIVLKPVVGNTYYTVSYTSVEGWPVDSVAASGVQAEDRPGFHNLPIIDQNNIYGYDQAYDQMSTHSMGTSAMINVNAEQYGTAKFSFYGTGFDVISTTSNQTGTFVVDIYAGTDTTKTPVVSKAVDTYYGYVYGLYNVVYQKNDNGVWVLVEVGEAAPAGSPDQSKEEITNQAPNQDGTVTGTMYTWKPVTNNPNALYQVPVITHSGLDYGQYTVVVSALYYSAFDATTDPGYDLYLDAIRIYNPAGTTYDEGNKDGNIDDDIQKAYTADGEAWPSYQELRNLIISDATFDALNGDDEEVDGIVFIDGDATLGEGNTVTGSAITDYTNYGPNNELYLAKDQAVAFNMNMGSANDHEGYVPVVRIGLKTVGGKTAIAEMWNTQVTKDKDGKVVSVNRYNAISDKLETATDMYYDITVLNNKTVVIKNSGEDGSILSITNIKLSYKPTVTSTAGINETAAVNDTEQGDTSMKLTISKSAAKAALMSLAPAQEEIPEPSVPETTEPQEPVPEEPVSDRLKSAVAAAKLLKETDYTAKSFKAVTTARKAAEKVLKDKKATEAKLEAALEALEAAVAALEAKADVTELKAAVDAAKKLKEKNYTPASYKAVTTARKAAEKVLKDKNANQAAADAALEALEAAVAALEAKPDLTALKAAVNAAKKLKEKNYTQETYEAVTTARKAAEKVLKDKNANQAAVDAALAELNTAVDALVERNLKVMTTKK